MNNKILIEIRDYFMVAVATLMYSVGLTVFMLPYKLTTGGLAGISALIYYGTGIEIEVSYAIMNILLLVGAARIIGLKFCIKSLWGFGLISFWLWFIQRIMEDPVTHQMPCILGENEAFMGCILCALIEGFALAICFKFNGSTGGTDIIAVAVNKYRDISLGQVLMYLDIVIVTSSYLVLHDVRTIIFGYVLLILSAITIDYTTRRFNQALVVYIFSRNYSAISDAITKAGFGLTVLEGTGWYTHTARKVLMCVCTKRYSHEVMEIVKRVDPTAFISVTNAQNVYGEGFNTLKTKIKGQKPIIVFATNNANKLREVREILGDRFEVRSLKEVGCFDELPETHDTLQENALQKAEYISQFYGFDCFADDTGLEVYSLNNEPGVYSARYASLPEDGSPMPIAESHDSEANMDKLLRKLDGKTGDDRRARFRTVIALIYKGEKHIFEGIVEGSITTERHGTEGFGYDPIFQPEGYTTTFAEMSSEEKNHISHRGRAVEKLVKGLAQ